MTRASFKPDEDDYAADCVAMAVDSVEEKAGGVELKLSATAKAVPAERAPDTSPCCSVGGGLQRAGRFTGLSVIAGRRLVVSAPVVVPDRIGETRSQLLSIQSDALFHDEDNRPGREYGSDVPFTLRLVCAAGSTAQP